MHGLKSAVKSPLICRILVLAVSYSICSATSLPLYGEDCRTSVNIEIVDDVINYEDDEPSLFIRGRVSENIGDKFLMNASVLRDMEEKNFENTWNIQVKSINDHLDFTAGHYNLRFGSGLMMGKKRYMSGDPFKRTLAISGDDAIIPSTGTNPAYTFSGTAMNLFSAGDDSSIGIIPFISIQRRFITSEELSGGYIKSTLATLSDKTDKTSKNSQCVNIINTGSMFYISWMELLTLQAYHFRTDLKDDTGKDIKWEYDTGDGIESENRSGIFVEYSDENISIFLEPAFSSRKYDSEVTGKGLMWGAGVRNRKMDLSVKGKNCEPEFHSEYSSADRNPENIFEIKTSITPQKRFKAGAVLYSEKNLNPSYGRDYTGGNLREEIFTEIKPAYLPDLSFNLARSRNYSDDLDSEQIKFSSSAVMAPLTYFFIRLKSDIQQESSLISFVSACEIRYLFFDYFTFSAGYTDIRVENGSSIYAAVIPAADAEACSTLYSESAHGTALKLRYRKDSLSFHVRGSYIRKEGEKEMKGESSLGFVF